MANKRERERGVQIWGEGGGRMKVKGAGRRGRRRNWEREEGTGRKGFDRGRGKEDRDGAVVGAGREEEV